MTATTLPTLPTAADLDRLSADLAAAHSRVAGMAEAMARRVGRLERALVVSAEAWDAYADLFDSTDRFGAALDCRRRARECREAMRP